MKAAPVIIVNRYNSVIYEIKILIKLVVMLLNITGGLIPGKPELKWEKEITITEGNKNYPLTVKLFKSRMVIEDKEDNKVAIDKRDNWIKIERRENVDWHTE